jgi:iron complex outermembrane recepter protein
MTGKSRHWPSPLSPSQFNFGCLRAALMGAGATVLGLATPGLAQAQTVPPVPVAQGQSGIEEVIVTARRREENLERVPISVSALSAQQLRQRSIVTQSDLQSAVPGLTLRETQGSNSLTYSIRGQTVDVFTGSSSAVVPYLDEVQLVTGGASTFFDLQSIQVLKGPQGTLFGRNTTGGAVLYTTAQPTDEFGGYVTTRVGEYDLREGQGAVNIPIVEDQLLLRVAGDLVAQDGYQFNLFDDRHLGAVDRKSGRATLLYRPTESFENTLLFEYDHSGGSSTANRLFAVNGVGSTNGGFALNDAAAATYNPASFPPAVWATYLAQHPQAYPGGIVAFLNQESPKLGFWQADEAGGVFHNEADYQLVDTTKYDIAPDTQIKNIFGFSSVNDNDQGSTVGAPFLVFTSQNLPLGEFGNRDKFSTYSEELQLQGKTLDQALTYTVGGFYWNQDRHTVYPQEYFDLTPISSPEFVDSSFAIDDRTEALYAQGDYDFSSVGLQGLKFTAGYRYSWEQVDIKQLADPYDFYYLKYGSDPEHLANSNPSWTLELSYQPTDNLLLYVDGRRSWRSGGFNGTAPPFLTTAAGGGNIFRPEFTRDVEVGAKDQWTFLGQPGYTNIAVYNQWIDNVQRAEFPVPPGGESIAVTINVPEAEVTGMDLDSEFHATDWFDLGVAGAITDARFVKGENEANIFGTLYVFNPYADTPRFSGSLYGVVTLPTPEEIGVMKLRADLYGQTDMYFSNNNSTITPGTKLFGYGLLNLRYDWDEVMGTDFSFGAYIKNVMDKTYYTGGFSLSSSLGVSSAAVGVPRMYGFELTYNF